MILFLLLFVFWQRVGFCLHLDKERVYYGEHVLINLVSIIIINDILSKCTWSFLLCHRVTHQASTSSAHKCSKIRLCSLDTCNNGKGNPEMRSSYSWLLKTRTEFISGVNCISWHGFCLHQCMWLFQDWMQWPGLAWVHPTALRPFYILCMEKCLIVSRFMKLFSFFFNRLIRKAQRKF